MDDYQEMERFGMDNDYEDGQWIGGEFYGKRRQKRTQNKDDVLYGVFASGDSDSDYEGSGSKKRRKDQSKRTDFTKPINFVSNGSVMPGQEIDHNTKEEDNDDMDDDDPKPTGLGLGASSASLGLDFAPSKIGTDEEEKDEDIDFLPSAFWKKTMEGVRLRRKENSLLAKKSFQSGNKDLDPSGVGSFEKHTKVLE